MKQEEFLEILRESLERKIPQEEIEDTLRYYREYFEQSGRSDEELCQELGDPRLIAKSVTKAYLASKGSRAEEYTQQARSEFSQMQARASYEENIRGSSIERILSKVMLWFIVLVVIIILALILRMTLAMLIPILFVVVLWKLIRGDW